MQDSDKFLLLNQTKYGLDGYYYALIGGLFEKGESALECAKRELLEEAGLEADMKSLGAYRVGVNRGGGVLHAFYAKNARQSAKKHRQWLTYSSTSTSTSGLTTHTTPSHTHTQT